MVTVAAIPPPSHLAQDNDWIRLNHGLWHTCVGIAFFFMFHSRKVDPKDGGHTTATTATTTKAADSGESHLA